MFEPHLVFLDLETTGASADRDRITEIGLIEIADDAYVGEWSTLVDPQRTIPESIRELTGITDQMVNDSPTFADVAPQLLERLDGRLLVAHNVHFDYAFLRAEFRRLGVRFHARTLCTVRLSRTLFPEHVHHNLDSVMERFGITCSARHRALGDAQVLWAFARELERTEPRERVAEAVALLTRAPVLPPGLDPERFEDLPIAPGVYVFYDADGKAIYAAKTTNLRSRVLAHFSQDQAHDRELRAALDTASLEWVETAGDLSASLREIALLRSLNPRLNRKRSAPEIWSLRWSDPNQPIELIPIDDSMLDSDEALYGTYRSRTDATAALRGIARGQQLCRILVGLESGEGPCSAYASGSCRGACVGAESRAQHLLRTMEALARLRFPAWPFKGRIGVREADPRRAVAEIHVLDNWRYLGTARTDEDLETLLVQRTLPPFDLDHFRVLQRTLRDESIAGDIIDFSHHPADIDPW